MATTQKPNELIEVERNHYLIVPSDPEQQKITDLVNKATWKQLLTEYKLRINTTYLTTFACVYMEALIITMRRIMTDMKSTENSINFLDLFTVYSNNRESDTAEKDGNINVSFVPGPTVTEGIMVRDFAPKVNPSLWDKSMLMEVQKTCARILSEKHKAVTDNLNIWTIVAYVYFEHVFRTMKLMAKEAHDRGESSVSFNFLEMVEFHCNLEVVTNPDNPDLHSDHYVVKMRPGFQAKLLIKNDDSTEMY